MRDKRSVRSLAIGSLMAGALPALVAAQGVTGYQQGKGGSPVQGAAGTTTSTGNPSIEHCEKPMGAVAVVEPQDLALQSLLRYNLQSPAPLIRMMIQQSNCFIVVERGVAMQNMQQERALSGTGNLRSGSNIGGGQMVGADFILTPNVVFNEKNAGGLGAGLAGLVAGSPTARSLGAAAGGLKFKEAQTSMLVADSRSGVQVACGRRQYAEGRPEPGRRPVRRRAAAAASAVMAIPTRARSSPLRSSTTTTRSCRSSKTILTCSGTSALWRRRLAP